MRRWRRRWWPSRGRLWADLPPPSTSATPVGSIDDQLAFAARLLRDARERGHHNEAERLRRWIDDCLDRRLKDDAP